MSASVAASSIGPSTPATTTTTDNTGETKSPVPVSGGSVAATSGSSAGASSSTALPAVAAPTPAEKKPACYWVGLAVGDTGAHFTLAWMDVRTAAEVEEAVADARILQAKLLPLRLRGGPFRGDFGKPEDVRAGKGIWARVYEPEFSPEQKDALMTFYRKWYFHREGEAEERKRGPTFHLTVDRPLPKSAIAELDTIECLTLFIKATGTPSYVVKFSKFFVLPAHSDSSATSASASTVAASGEAASPS
jgi:hypothetical protein